MHQKLFFIEELNEINALTYFSATM